jgi:hypothetical protein
MMCLLTSLIDSKNEVITNAKSANSNIIKN